MGVAGGRLRLRMTEQLADDREAKTRSSANRRKCVPQVVQSNSFEPGAPTDGQPGLLEICPRPVRMGAAYDERAVARMRLQNLEGRAVQHNRLSASLGIRQQQKTTPQIDVLPAQVENLSQPGAGEDQEAKRGGGVRRKQGTLVFFPGQML